MSAEEYRADCNACLHDLHYCEACEDVVGHDHEHGEE